MRLTLFSARITGSGAVLLLSAIVRRHAAFVFVPPISRGVLNINNRFMSSQVASSATPHAASPTASSAGDSRLTGRIYELVGREFDIGKPAVLSKVRGLYVEYATQTVFVLSCCEDVSYSTLLSFIIQCAAQRCRYWVK